MEARLTQIRSYDDLAGHLTRAGLNAERFSDAADFHASWIETPIGPLITVTSDAGLHLMEFPERKALGSNFKRLLGQARALRLASHAMADRTAHALDLYFSGQEPGFALPQHPKGSDFERQHWAALLDIPAGQARTYGAMAELLGKPGAYRAVGRANGANPIAIAIPCHRLVAADGNLTGYGGGLWRKRWLLDHETKHYGRTT